MNAVLEAMEQPAIDEKIAEFRREQRRLERERIETSEVIANQYELGYDAWANVNGRIFQMIHHGIWLWHAGSRPATILKQYGHAARNWSDLANRFDFSQPVQTYEGLGTKSAMKFFGTSLEAEVESWKQRNKQPIERITYDSTRGARVWFRSSNSRVDELYSAEQALLCACIGRDWTAAENIAKIAPTKKPQPRSARGDSCYLLRCCVLGKDKKAAAYGKTMSSRGQGIDFPPTRPDLALAAIAGDAKRVAKAVRSSLKTFTEKWTIEKYITRQALKRYGNDRDTLHDVVVRDLINHHWIYSSWTIAMCAIAERRNLDPSAHEDVFNEFAPRSMCVTR